MNKIEIQAITSTIIALVVTTLEINLADMNKDRNFIVSIKYYLPDIRFKIIWRSIILYVYYRYKSRSLLYTVGSRIKGF